jgi:hypothetical protein
MKESSCHDPKMAVYCQEVCKLEDKFDSLKLSHIPRWLNEAADELAKMVSGRELGPGSIFASNQHKHSVHFEEPGKAGNEPPTSGLGAGASDKSLASSSGADLPAALSDPELMEIDEDADAEHDPPANWRTPYLDCLIRKALLADKIEAWRLACHAKSFIIIREELYKKSCTGVLQRCIPTEQGKKLLDGIHRGSCEHHAGPRTLGGKAF